MIFYDGHPDRLASVILAVLLQAAQSGRVFTKDARQTIIRLALPGALPVSDTAVAVSSYVNPVTVPLLIESPNPFGPLADSGADQSFVGSRHESEAINVRAAVPISVGTCGGVVSADSKATVIGAGGLLTQEYMLPDSLESLVSVGQVCETTGCGYTQDPGNQGARFWHPDHPKESIELERDGRLFRAPMGCTPVTWTTCSAFSTVAPKCSALDVMSPAFEPLVGCAWASLVQKHNALYNAESSTFAAACLCTASKCLTTGTQSTASKGTLTMPAVIIVFVVAIVVDLQDAPRRYRRLFGMDTCSVGTLLVFMKGISMATLWLSWLVSTRMAMTK